MTDRYAVFGNPVEHSKSPWIHRAFAQQFGEVIEYRKQLVEPGRFNAAADEFFAGGGRGLNVTVPFKRDAYSYAAKLTARARRAGAVNTLAIQAGGKVLGDTTDGVGLVADIVRNLGWKIAEQRVLIIGAGGAVRGVLQALLAERPALLVIANRTGHKARQLAGEFADLGQVWGGGFDELPAGGFDLLFNGTSASLAGELPPLPEDLILRETAVYDMMYAPDPTIFMQWAASRGAVHLADGLGMLVEQAAESFALWRNQRPRTAEVIRELRAGMTPS